jgi:hypothetical protein
MPSILPRRALRLGLVAVVLAGVAAALVPVGPVAARPRRADIAITGMVAGPAEVLLGEVVGIGVTVANVGGRVSDVVTVDVTLPPTLRPTSPGGVGIPWACWFTAPSWRCTHAALAPGQVADELHLQATVVAGAPGDVLAVTAQASTASRELSTVNNTGQAGVNLIAAATVRGTAWIDDDDRDGQRDPGEPTTPGSLTWWARLYTEDGSEFIEVEVAADGRYSLAVKPNRYFVEVTVSPYAPNWGFTTPNVGDDATDSDVVPAFTDEFGSHAHSHVFEAAGGGETIVDIGLTEEPLA